MITAIQKDDRRFIQKRTCGSMNRQGRSFDRMYIEKGNKGRRITIAPGIVFVRAK